MSAHNIHVQDKIRKFLQYSGYDVKLDPLNMSVGM